ncbi:hypothetical protein ACWEAF_32230 [Streptomyces sp. NPDC005071]|uniref:hypothetical protein n=1 Tax=Streptomyces sp. NPDC057291 TaxID=3346087 RepID=UPI00363DB764
MASETVTTGIPRELIASMSVLKPAWPISVEPANYSTVTVFGRYIDLSMARSEPDRPK